MQQCKDGNMYPNNAPNNAPKITAKQLNDIRLKYDLTYDRFAQIARLSGKNGRQIVKEWEKAASTNGFATIAWKNVHALIEAGYLKKAQTYTKSNHVSKMSGAPKIPTQANHLNDCLAMLIKSLREAH